MAIYKVEAQKAKLLDNEKKKWVTAGNTCWLASGS